MAVNFPDSPSNGDTTILNDVTYTYTAATNSWSDGSSGNFAKLISYANLAAFPSSNNADGNLGFSEDTNNMYMWNGTSWVLLNNGSNIPTDVSDLADSTSLLGSGGATIYANMAALVAATGMSSGDFALVSDLNKVFMYTGSGWFLVATMTNDSPTAITGVNASYTLATDGTATTITAVSTDPEGFPLTWSSAVTSGSLNGTTLSGVDNVFTITPHASNETAFSVTFSVTDGSSGATSATAAFTLSFSVWGTFTNFSTSSWTQDSSYQFPTAYMASAIQYSDDGQYLFYRSGGNITLQSVSPYWSTSFTGSAVTYTIGGSSPTATGAFKFANSGQTFIYESASTSVTMVNLGTAYNVTTATNPATKNFSTTIGDIRDIAINAAGTKLTLLQNSNSSQYASVHTLSTSWDITTASTTAVNIDLNAMGLRSSDRPFGIIDGDGMHMFVTYCNPFSPRVIHYTFGTDGDYSTLSKANTHDLPTGNDQAGYNLYIKSTDLSKAYMVVNYGGPDRTILYRWDTGFN